MVLENSLSKSKLKNVVSSHITGRNDIFIIRRIIVFFWIFLGTNAYCQSTGLNSSSGYEQRGLGIYTMSANTENVKIKGSKYLFPDWKTNAVIATKDGKNYKISGLNYDVELDKIVAKVGVDSLFSFNPAGISQARINNRSFRRYLDPELNRNSFYEVLVVKDNMELLKRFNIEIKDGYVNPMTKTQEAPNSYALKEAYFLSKGGEVKKIPSKKREFFAFFGNQAVKIKEYVKENKLSIKKEFDLKRIFTYYDSL